LAGDAWWGGRIGKRRALMLALPPLAILGGALAYGLVRPKTLELRKGPIVAAIQGNIPQDLKEQPMYGPERLRQHIELTDRVLGQPVELIIWPETMLPGLLDRDPALKQVIANLARKHDAHLLLGGFHIDAERKGIFHNSTWFLDRRGTIIGRYDKVRLVPMSEYIPFKHSAPWLHRWLQSMVPPSFESLDPGEDIVLFRLNGASFAPFICFENSFSDLVADAVRRGSTFIVFVSNDAWFKRSAELEMARSLTVFRAVETRRGIVRVVNTGISGFFDPLGHIRDIVVNGKLKQVEGVLVQAVMTTDEETIYVRFGDVLVALLFGWTVLLVIGAAIIPRLRRPS